MRSLLSPAKINLFLHILGKNAKNYHILESLVMFADFGDQLSYEDDGKALNLKIIGPYADKLNQDNAENLIITAAKLLGEKLSLNISGSFVLEKNLPIASGIGGGSSNAATALRLLADHHQIEDQKIDDLLMQIGADVPVCFYQNNCIMYGMGEGLKNLDAMPKFHALLVNPNLSVSTGKIFNSLNASNEVAPYQFIDQHLEIDDWLTWIKAQDNHMQPAASEICPEINNVLAAIEQTEQVQLARMSGSGATCFGLYPNAEAAEMAEAAIKKSHPNYWVRSCIFG